MNKYTVTGYRKTGFSTEIEACCAQSAYQKAYENENHWTLTNEEIAYKGLAFAGKDILEDFDEENEVVDEETGEETSFFLPEFQQAKEN